MKTGREFLETLPTNIRLAWAKATINHCGTESAKRKLETVYPNFERFILCSFVWENSKQGHEFWLKISKQ
jgi:hypothetical protein